MRRNTTIQRLELTNASLNESFVSALADALADNRNSLLSSIDFSDNKYAHFPPTFFADIIIRALGDKAAVSMAALLDALPQGCTVLKLRGTGATSKGAVAIGQALKNKRKFEEKIKVLDISKNKWGNEGVAPFMDFVSHSSCLRTLNIAETGASAEGLPLF